MPYFCEKCMEVHNDDVLCPRIKEQIKSNPSLVYQATTFANIASQPLISTQVLGDLANKINHLTGINLPTYEGTIQFSRDIQVFQRLNEECYPRLGAFKTPSAAESYLESASKNQLKNLSARISGAGQEIDWLRRKQGSLSNVVNKSNLLTGNAPGIDGESICRFTGKTIERTTIKATQTPGGLNTNVQGIVKSLKAGTLNPDDVAFGNKGFRDALIKKLSKEISHERAIGNYEVADKLTEAQKNLRIQENHTPQNTAQSVDRLKGKIRNGEACHVISSEQVFKKAAQGAVIGAAVSLTVSALTSYIRYKNGEITQEEAFSIIGKDTAKGALVGGALSGVSLFLPAGKIGFVGGMIVGVYLNAVLKNILDEIFGEGAYKEILISQGYIYGTSITLLNAVQQIKAEEQKFESNMLEIQSLLEQADSCAAQTDKILEEL